MTATQAFLLGCIVGPVVCALVTLVVLMRAAERPRERVIPRQVLVLDAEDTQAQRAADAFVLLVNRRLTQQARAQSGNPQLWN